MPTKRTVSKPAASKADKCDCCNGCGCCASATRKFWRWFLTIVLVVVLFAMGCIVMVVYQQTLSLSYAVDSMGLRPVLQHRGGLTVQQNPAVQYKESAVPGMWLAYKACPATFTGACDDASIYKLSGDGSKEVVVASVRGLAGAPLGGELLQPMSVSPDGNLLVMGAWAFGSNRNANDKRVWLYDLSKSAVVAKSSSVPANAVFSPDYAYAAYAVSDGNDIRDVMIVNISTDKTVSGAKADDARTFKGQDGLAQITWKDAKTLVVAVYSVPSGSGASSVPVKTGEKTIKVK